MASGRVPEGAFVLNSFWNLPESCIPKALIELKPCFKHLGIFELALSDTVMLQVGFWIDLLSAQSKRKTRLDCVKLCQMPVMLMVWVPALINSWIISVL